VNEQKRLAYFMKVAPDLFGRYWKTNSALYFGKTIETIANWRKGKTPVPHSIVAALKTCVMFGLIYDEATNDMKAKKNVKRRPA
jgi:hypothetical protein